MPIYALSVPSKTTSGRNQPGNQAVPSVMQQNHRQPDPEPGSVRNSLPADRASGSAGLWWVGLRRSWCRAGQGSHGLWPVGQKYGRF